MSNDMISIIKTRRSIRAFSEKQIPTDVLREIAQTAVYAPSAMNRQMWHFAVISKKEDIERLASAVRTACSRDESYDFYRPTAMIITSADKNTPFGRDDCACAIQNIFLAAHSLGIGSVWINQIRDVCDAPEVREILTDLGVPEGHAVYGTAALGYPSAPPRITEKKLENISYR